MAQAMSKPKKVKESLSDMVNRRLSFKEQLLITLQLSAPAIMSQLSTITMQYIDAAMVGSLGAKASASIGLMMAPMWLFSGVCISSVSGFSVQVAHLLGGRDDVGARRVMRQSYIVLMLLTIAIGGLGCALSGVLPVFLGGSPDINGDATAYFFILMACMPFFMLNFISSAMLRCAGNMMLPSLLNIFMCVLDVLFNFIFIFETKVRNIPLIGEVTTFGFGYGVKGAAIGTAIAMAIVGLILFYYVTMRSRSLAIFKERGSFKPTLDVVRRALRISIPISAQQFMISSAQIVSTMIVAPLGTVAIAAHSFAITIEAICYMPGIGIADAATTLVGQSLGARKIGLTKIFARLTISVGVVVMTIMGALMYIFAPYVMAIMTPDLSVQEQAVAVLRIEAFAEPLLALSIVGYGVCVGAGDTLIPSILNFGSMWVVRLAMAYYLSLSHGLKGVWIAMAIELTIRGLLFLIHLRYGNWMKHALDNSPLMTQRLRLRRIKQPLMSSKQVLLLKLLLKSPSS